MKTVAIVCNFVLLAFMCLVLATDGFPTRTVFVVLTLLVLAIPIFTVIVLLRRKACDTDADARSPRSNLMAWVAAACNILLLGLMCWAYIDQYPHPDEEGFLAFMVVVLVTPVLSALALLMGTPGRWLTSTK